MNFTNFSFTHPGSNASITPEIMAFSLPSDRYLDGTSYSASVVIALTGSYCQTLPSDYDGFVVERSANFGATYAVVSGASPIRNSFRFVDAPGSAGVFFYRVTAKTIQGTASSYSNEVEVTVGSYGSADDLGFHEVQAKDGVVTSRLGKGQAFPPALGVNEQFMGNGLAEGSFGGSFGAGAFFVPTRESVAPQFASNVPACGASGVAPRTTITYSIQDLPYPAGGSGIDDSSIIIRLSCSTQYSGSALLVRNGATQPFSGSTPNITCVIVAGADPAKDRNVTITVPSGYFGSQATVTTTTTVSDLDGNTATQTCSFVMSLVDTTEPVVNSHSPTCDLGIASTDSARALRDTDYSFVVSDSESGVVLSSLQVYYSTSSSGPWTQILQNGSTFLAGFTGTVTGTSASYSVLIRRPSTDPYWNADTAYYIKVNASDVSGNATEKICGFKTQACLSASKVVPLAENMLFVQFSIGATDGAGLRNPNNYTIAGVDANAVEQPVTVKRVLTQGFSPATDPQNPGDRVSTGFPEFVVLDTGKHAPFQRYSLALGASIEDRYGFPPCDPNLTVYRARRTKLDDGRESIFDVNLLQQNSKARQIIGAILREDDEIGGVFSLDDWDFV